MTDKEKTIFILILGLPSTIFLGCCVYLVLQQDWPTVYKIMAISGVPALLGIVLIPYLFGVK